MKELEMLLSEIRKCTFVFAVAVINVAFAECVTFSVPEGDHTLDAALKNGYAGEGIDYDALLKADDLEVSGSGRLIIDKDLKTDGYAGEIHVKSGSTLRVTVQV